MENRTERIRAIVSAVAVLAVNIAAVLGFDLDAGTAQSVLLLALVVAATVWGCYKNHNFTKAAALAQAFLDAFKNGGGTEWAESYLAEEVSENEGD